MVGAVASGALDEAGMASELDAGRCPQGRPLPGLYRLIALSPITARGTDGADAIVSVRAHPDHSGSAFTPEPAFDAQGSARKSAPAAGDQHRVTGLGCRIKCKRICIAMTTEGMRLCDRARSVLRALLYAPRFDTDDVGV